MDSNENNNTESESNNNEDEQVPSTSLLPKRSRMDPSVASTSRYNNSFQSLFQFGSINF